MCLNFPLGVSRIEKKALEKLRVAYESSEAEEGAKRRAKCKTTGVMEKTGLPELQNGRRK